jgi:hypothetical protein
VISESIGAREVPPLYHTETGKKSVLSVDVGASIAGGRSTVGCPHPLRPAIRHRKTTPTMPLIFIDILLRVGIIIRILLQNVHERQSVMTPTSYRARCIIVRSRDVMDNAG